MYFLYFQNTSTWAEDFHYNVIPFHSLSATQNSYNSSDLVQLLKPAGEPGGSGSSCICCGSWTGCCNDGSCDTWTSIYIIKPCYCSAPFTPILPFHNIPHLHPHPSASPNTSIPLYTCRTLTNSLYLNLLF